MAYKVLTRGHRHLNLARSATLKPSGINHGDMGGEKKGNINAMACSKSSGSPGSACAKMTRACLFKACDLILLVLKSHSVNKKQRHVQPKVERGSHSIFAEIQFSSTIGYLWNGGDGIGVRSERWAAYRPPLPLISDADLICSQHIDQSHLMAIATPPSSAAGGRGKQIASTENIFI
ncbi:uncharacterized protein BO96DRAFT_341799 [Aspergillus niger CBS 101883]|uniref:Uncharacterized protein n=2 Tax=Aspergillus niger TaxID=5061 RepID=A2R9C9_ASPNC|nr:uncharacterized protein BO96DRAFT_341799 [Aspergillus niger CBS 101883]XP_059605694.1 hypothetical protein An17g00920 [Aspergillus niger]PYH54876.1 hypothetical protein BO96DRAFT_341799 [Aspergillus niger CBS 101883]CAK48794.1 hypothetical protein An17g00920 [Aspergillus niger]